MKLTLEMLLYFIRDLNPVICHGFQGGEIFSGVKQFYSRDVQPEYLYVGKLSGLLEGDVACAVLAVNDIGWTEAEIGKFPGSLILVDATYQVPYLIKLPLVFSDGKNNACQDALLRGLS
ncbi:MAG: hypothetical protein HFI42_02745 [Lachnospiraceae bacterium]|nr:hypothetical protein [Lachnospiraceae bacterium]